MKVRFKAFTLDTETRQLTRGREALHLSTKAFDLLSLLVERRPAVVEKAALREHLWPGTHVVEASLGNLVAEVRGVLGDRPADPLFVRTVHGVGYAFSAETMEAAHNAGADAGGAPRFWLTWKGRDIALAEAETEIGRDPACAAWIDAPGVSRRHARIRLIVAEGKTRAELEDLDSTNGTFLGSRRVVKKQSLNDGDRVRLGEATLTFHAWKYADTPTKRVRAPKA